MTEPYRMNGLFLAFAEMLYGDEADEGAAEQAFTSSDGPFLERITAAINALLRPHLEPERFIEIPDNAEKMKRADLEALVRPVAEGFVQSQPTKDELLYELGLIARRQASRPSWMPRTDDSVSSGDVMEESEDFLRPVPMALTGFSELGEVTITAPAYYGDVVYDAASRDPAVLQLALLTIFGAADASAAGRTIRGDGDALDALVPVERRWWLPPEMAPTPRAADEDPGVAVEVLATTQSLGGMPVQDIQGPDAAALVADVLLGTGSWNHSPRIVVDGWQPFEGSRFRSLARASFAGWADDSDEGFVVAVLSGGWEETAGVFPLGHRLHASIVWWTAPPPGATEAAGVLRRIVLHCPGAGACQRGGCEITVDDALLAAVGIVAADATVTVPIAAGADWAADSHRSSLLGTDDDESDEVLSAVTRPLLAAGWEEISNSSSELGDAGVLLSRQGQVLTVEYRPLTRSVVLTDGRPELDMLSQLLADEGGRAEGPEGLDRVDRTAAAAAGWDDPLLTVMEKHLLGELPAENVLPEPIEMLLAGIWPWGTGVPQSDHDWDLVNRQVAPWLARTTLLGN
jgi:hypothetical protein